MANKSSRRKKGFSLHIGVNWVNRQKFKERVRRLNAPENDAKAMAAIAAERGYENIKVSLGAS